MHIPVMKDEVMKYICVRDGGLYIDATYGGGGHSAAILEKGGCVLGIDKDASIITNNNTNYEAMKNNERFRLVHDTFANIVTIWNQYAAPMLADGIIADLGFSSNQIDDKDRGFSFQHDAELDMRYDQSSGITAAEWLNKADAAEMADIFWRYGEERNAEKIANSIVRYRIRRQLTTTNDLIKIIMQHNSRKPFEKHIATRVFQAIRIHINNELDDLRKFLVDARSVLKDGSVLCVITFHSIEDRIVKNEFKKYVNFHIAPDEKEISHNPRSRSARLRWMVNDTSMNLERS